MGLLYTNVYMHGPTAKLDYNKKTHAPSNAQTVQTLTYIGPVSLVELFENLMFQIRLKPTPMFWKYSSVGQIRSQIFGVNFKSDYLQKSSAASSLYLTRLSHI